MQTGIADGASKPLWENLPEDLREPEPNGPAARLFVAARAVFAERGFDGSSTRAIAERAGLNQALVHYYFGSKEKLYRRVLATSILRLLRHQGEDRVGVLPADDLFVQFPGRLLDWFRQEPETARLLRREIGSGGGRLAALLKELGPRGPRGMLPQLEQAFLLGVEQGRLRDLPFRPLFGCLLALSYGFVLMEPLLRAVFGEQWPGEADHAERGEAIVALLSGGLKPAAAGAPPSPAQLALGFGDDDPPAPRRASTPYPTREG